MTIEQQQRYVNYVDDARLFVSLMYVCMYVRTIGMRRMATRVNTKDSSPSSIL